MEIKGNKKSFVIYLQLHSATTEKRKKENGASETGTENEKRGKQTRDCNMSKRNYTYFYSFIDVSMPCMIAKVESVH